MSPAPTAAAAGVLIDAPAPRPPLYTLIGAATVVPMTDDEHYLMGVALRGYACGPSHAWDDWHKVGAAGETTKITITSVPTPAFQGFAVYLREECNSRGLDGVAYADRIERVFPAVEAYAVEREFWTGGLLATQPHLAGPIPVGGPDITVFPHADVAQTAVEGLAALEGSIAQTGRAGIIHAAPSLVTYWKNKQLVEKANTTPPTLQTINGTVVVPGYGYESAAGVMNGSTPVPPATHAAPTGTQEWAFATGQIEVRRSPNIEMIPEATDEALWQAVDRANNLLAYEALRYYVVDWDACFKAAVLIDRAT